MSSTSLSSFIAVRRPQPAHPSFALHAAGCREVAREINRGGLAIAIEAADLSSALDELRASTEMRELPNEAQTWQWFVCALKGPSAAKTLAP